jgi:hypothetical protein
VCVVVVVVGFELRAYPLSHFTSFVLVYFFMSYLPRLALNCDPPDSAS